jgi:hypothetical protein
MTCVAQPCQLFLAAKSLFDRQLQCAHFFLRKCAILTAPASLEIEAPVLYFFLWTFSDVGYSGRHLLWLNMLSSTLILLLLKSLLYHFIDVRFAVTMTLEKSWDSASSQLRKQQWDEQRWRDRVAAASGQHHPISVFSDGSAEELHQIPILEEWLPVRIWAEMRLGRETERSRESAWLDDRSYENNTRPFVKKSQGLNKNPLTAIELYRLLSQEVRLLLIPMRKH